MTDQRDPFDALRQPGSGARPDPAFVARVRRQVVAALTGTDDPADLPVVDLDVPRSDSAPVRSAAPETASAAALVPYLCVSGATEAIEWYSSVLGAVEVVRYTGDDGRIGHAELAIGPARLYLSDDYPEIGVAAPPSLGGTSASLHLEVADVDSVHAAAIAAGAIDHRPPADQPYGARAAVIVDPFGHRWMLQTTIATPTLAEINAAMEGFTVTAGEPTEPEPIEREPIELGYFTLTATDTDRAARFYGALFGWRTEAGNLGDSYRHVHNTRLPLGIEPGISGDPATLYFRVPDVAEYVARVRRLGGQIVSMGDWEAGPGAECRDDQGGTFHLWQAAPGY